MNQEILSRYNKEPNGPYIIDISIEKNEDIFSEYDGVIAWNRKDLDEEINRYLMDCIAELEPAPWIIRLNLRTKRDESAKKKIIYAWRSFFRYKRLTAWRDFLKLLRRTAYSGIIGLSILIPVTVWGHFLERFGHAGEIAREGLHVAIWVTIWHAIADLLYEIRPTWQIMRRYKRAAEARIIFRYPD